MSKYVTTSSCSGRICVFLLGNASFSSSSSSSSPSPPESEEPQKKEKGGGGERWLVCKHDHVTFEEVLKSLSTFPSCSSCVALFKVSLSIYVPSLLFITLTFFFFLSFFSFSLCFLSFLFFLFSSSSMSHLFCTLSVLLHKPPKISSKLQSNVVLGLLLVVCCSSCLCS